MTIWTYKVAQDYGFAPNPFHGVCTLACCKPGIRKSAKKGDWIIGVGVKDKRKKGGGLHGKVIYVMVVDESMTFQEYWDAPQFQVKKPVANGTYKMFFGDNIYHQDPKTGQYHQSNSHHTQRDGQPNLENMRRDTQTNRVLIARKYVYFGEDAIEPPSSICDGLSDVFPHDGRLYHYKYSEEMQKRIKEWLGPHIGHGLQGLPRDWDKAIEGGGK